jgi:hypothetical protein
MSNAEMWTKFDKGVEPLVGAADDDRVLFLRRWCYLRGWGWAGR